MNELARIVKAPERVDAIETSHGVAYVRHEVSQRVFTAPSVIVLGAFDGVHVGHRKLVADALEDARVRRDCCVVVTFDPDPSEVVGLAGVGERLLSTEHRRNALLSLGVDCVVVLSFTPAMASLLPEEFVRQVIMDIVRPVSVHIGTNFRFGARGAGDIKTLSLLGKANGFSVHAHDLVEFGGASVSSSRIRELLRGGRVSDAKELLGRSHFVRGTVRHGRGEGTAFGFPTANVECDVVDCLPAEGVYACYAIIGDEVWPAATNVGAPPTFASPRSAFLETNLIGFNADIYQTSIIVTFEHWLRASRSFSSIEELERVVNKNIEWVRRNLGTSSKGLIP